MGFDGADFREDNMVGIHDSEGVTVDLEAVFGAALRPPFGAAHPPPGYLTAA